MKVTVLLRNDHNELRTLFTKFRKPNSRNPNGKREVFNEICREVSILSQMEMDIFYPALAATSVANATTLVAEAEAEHQEIEKLMESLKNTSNSDKHFEAGVNRLMEQIEVHMDKEETAIFDIARRNLPEFRLEELGLEMEDRRRLLTTLAA